MAWWMMGIPRTNGGQVRIVEASSTIGGTFENKAYKERAWAN